MHYAKAKRRRKLPSNDPTNNENSGTRQPGGDAMQGEGNYQAAREFNAAQRRFVQSGKVEAAARAAAPKTDREKQQLFAAEEEARRRAKEDYPPPPEARPSGTDAARSEPSKDAPRRGR
jgi:hypothetical protein